MYIVTKVTIDDNSEACPEMSVCETKDGYFELKY